MANRAVVGDDEIVATEEWMGRPFPDGVKALWSEVGYGRLDEAGDVLLGPFEIIDAVADATPRIGGSLPFFRTADGKVFRVDMSGQVMDAQGDRIAVGPSEIVRRVLDGETLDADWMRPPAEGLLTRTLRTVATAVAVRRVETPSHR